MESGKHTAVARSLPYVKSLPPEILADIFILCLPKNPPGIPSLLEAPLVLGIVCHEWRDISSSTPKLWTSFQLCVKQNFRTWSAGKEDCLVAAFTLWISKSGSYLPLSLGVTCPAPFTDRPRERFDIPNAILRAMEPYMHRCRHFTLHLLRSDVIRDTLGFYDFPWSNLRLPKSLPCLEHVDLDLPCGNADQVLIKMFNSKAPRLRSVCVAGFPPSLLNYNITWGMLTDLRTTSAESIQNCCTILHLAPNLKNCRLDLHVADHVRKALHMPQQIIHHSLERLYIGPSNLNLFFKSVTLPSLKSLSFDGKTVTEWGPEDDMWPTIIREAKWGQAAFLAFLTRSNCRLTKLSFYDLKISPLSLIQCLEAVSPTLVELHIEGGNYCQCVDQKVMNVLTYRHPEQPVGNLGSRFLCPRLERIRMRGYIFTPMGTGRHMVDMLESRYRQAWPIDGLSQLRWAYVGGTYRKKQWDRILLLERDGLELLVVEEGKKYLPNFIDDPSLHECELNLVASN